MSVRVMTDVWDSNLEGSTVVHVMQVLANEADDDGMNCFPGTRRIARRARLSERSVIRILQQLAEGEWLWVLQPGSGAGNRTEFRLNVDRLREQAEANRARERGHRAQKKGCHGVTLLSPSRPEKRVTTGKKKGDTHAQKGDNGDTPLYVLPVIDPQKHPLPLTPLPREGGREVELDHAVAQVESALSLANRRRLRLVRRAIALEMDKGMPGATAALALIAAVRKKAELGHLLRPCGLDRFLGDGLWKDERQWPWDKDVLRETERRRGAAIGVSR